MGAVPTGDLFPLLDHVEELQYWVKDRAHRYRRVNRGFLPNYSLRGEEQVVGRGDEALSPPHLVEQFHRDDDAALDGTSVVDRIELVGSWDHCASWHLTTKVPLRAASGAIIGTAGMTRRLPGAGVIELPDPDLERVVGLMRSDFHRELDNAELAAVAGLSISAFERRFRRAFRTTPQRLLGRLRVTEACRVLLRSEAPLASIALDCGFCDQSHFGRVFRRSMGESPARFRRRHRNIGNRSRSRPSGRK